MLIIDNPYELRANEYQGQVHFHSDESSDGTDTPTVIVTAYRDVGYDFVNLTDHVLVTADPGVANITFITGVEEEPDEGHLGVINATNVYTVVPGVTPAQTVINSQLADGAIPIINHPDLGGNVWTDEELETITGYKAFEIYNALVLQNAEAKWDTLLSKGIEAWGIATDDCHDILAVNFDKAWIQVFANTLSVASIVAEIDNGNFYSTQGPTLAITVVGKYVTVSTPDDSTIEWIGNNGTVLQSALASKIDWYQIEGDEIYLRIRITRDSDSELAWSNPIYVSEEDPTCTNIPWTS